MSPENSTIGDVKYKLHYRAYFEFIMIARTMSFSQLQSEVAKFAAKLSNDENIAISNNKNLVLMTFMLFVFNKKKLNELYEGFKEYLEKKLTEIRDENAQIEFIKSKIAEAHLLNTFLQYLKEKIIAEPQLIMNLLPNVTQENYKELIKDMIIKPLLEAVTEAKRVAEILDADIPIFQNNINTLVSENILSEQEIIWA